jgi:predicted transposase/invertase (TIGR01784 family)
LSYDNICKFLAEEYPKEFAKWLLCGEPQDVQVLKTELSLEPINADALTLLQTANEILHIEFQTLPASEPPLPLRMLDYWVRLHRKYRVPVQQFVIFLKETNSEGVFTQEFILGNTRHRYQVLRLWEQEPAIFLANPVLLPFAALARSQSPEQLLEQIADQVANIEEGKQRQNIAAATQVLAGLRFDDEEFINQLFGEEIMRESVIYQKIIREGVQIGKQEGRQEGRQQGRQEEASRLILRQLTRRFGVVDTTIQERIHQLSVMRLEDLGDALLDFANISDLTTWLTQDNSQN